VSLIAPYSVAAAPGIDSSSSPIIDGSVEVAFPSMLLTTSYASMPLGATKKHTKVAVKRTPRGHEHSDLKSWRHYPCGNVVNCSTETYRAADS
jgi:hypothetical protein